MTNSFTYHAQLCRSHGRRNCLQTCWLWSYLFWELRNLVAPLVTWTYDFKMHCSGGVVSYIACISSIFRSFITPTTIAWSQSNARAPLFYTKNKMCLRLVPVTGLSSLQLERTSRTCLHSFCFHGEKTVLGFPQQPWGSPWTNTSELESQTKNIWLGFQNNCHRAF